MPGIVISLKGLLPGYSAYTHFLIICGGHEAVKQPQTRWFHHLQWRQLTKKKKHFPHHTHSHYCKKMDGNLFVTGRNRRLPVVVITGTPSIFDRFRLGSPFGRQPVSRLAPTAVMFTNNLGHAVVSSHCFPLFCFHGVKILLRHVVDNKTHKKWWVAPKSTGVKRKARGPESARRSLQEFYF